MLLIDTTYSNGLYTTIITINYYKFVQVFSILTVGICFSFSTSQNFLKVFLLFDGIRMFSAYLVFFLRLVPISAKVFWLLFMANSERGQNVESVTLQT